MPRASQNKTASARKQDTTNWQFAMCFLLLMAVIFCGRVFSRIDHGQQLPTQNVTLDGNNLTAEIADDDEERAKGLSGRNNLPANHALILSYQKRTPGSIWMKDMKFSIDALWVMADGKVVGFVKDLKPESYPKAYYSSVPVTTVVELPAGYIDAHKIRAGSTLRFN